jgi:hypothetical protein
LLSMGSELLALPRRVLMMPLMEVASPPTAALLPCAVKWRCSWFYSNLCLTGLPVPRPLSEEAIKRFRNQLS